MHQQSNVIRSTQNQGLTKPSNVNSEIALVSQPDASIEAMKQIAYALQRLALLYQIPNWTENNSVLLAEWVYDNYKYSSLELILSALRNPDYELRGTDKNYRLTPDNIKIFMQKALEKDAEQREKEVKKLGVGDKELIVTYEVTPETEKLIEEYKEAIKKIDLKSVRPMSEAEWLKEGQEKPKSVKYAREKPSDEEIFGRALRFQWGKLYHDKYTGDPLPGWKSEDEWLKTVTPEQAEKYLKEYLKGK